MTVRGVGPSTSTYREPSFWEEIKGVISDAGDAFVRGFDTNKKERMLISGKVVEVEVVQAGFGCDCGGSVGRDPDASDGDASDAMPTTEKHDAGETCPLDAGFMTIKGDGDEGEICIADKDGDRIPDNHDNCPSDINPDQRNTDADYDCDGDACDHDRLPQGINDEYAVLSFGGLTCHAIDLDIISRDNAEWVYGLCDYFPGPGRIFRCPTTTPENVGESGTCESVAVLDASFAGEGGEIRPRQLYDMGNNRLAVPWETDSGLAGLTMFATDSGERLDQFIIDTVTIGGGGGEITVEPRGLGALGMLGDWLIMPVANPDPALPGAFGPGYVLGDPIGLETSFNNGNDFEIFAPTTNDRPSGLAKINDETVAVLNAGFAGAPASIDILNTSQFPPDEIDANLALGDGPYNGLFEMATDSTARYFYVANLPAVGASSLISVVDRENTSTPVIDAIQLPEDAPGALRDLVTRGEDTLAMTVADGSFVMATLVPPREVTCHVFAGFDAGALAVDSAGMAYISVTGAFWQTSGESNRIIAFSPDQACADVPPPVCDGDADGGVN